MFFSIFIFLLIQPLYYFGKTQNEEVFDRFFKYLLIDKNVQTHVHPYNNQNAHRFEFYRWISEEAMNGLVIYWTEFEEILGKEKALNFYRINQNQPIFYNDKNGVFCYVIDIVRKVFNTGVMMIPPKYFGKLEEQLQCLIEFLFMTYGEDYLIGDQFTNEHPMPEELIDFIYKIEYDEKNYVYRWDSNKTGDKEREFLMNGFDKNGIGYVKLDECLKIKIFEDESDASDKDTILFDKFYNLYKRFHPKQLYFRKIPIFIIKNENQTKYRSKNIEGNFCNICLEAFIEGEDIHVNPNCKHIHHVNCIAKWAHNSEECPTCRAIIPRLPKLKRGTKAWKWGSIKSNINKFLSPSNLL